MTVVTGDGYLESLVKFVENQAGPLIEGTLVLKLNPVGLHYVYSRLEALAELESLLAGTPVDYLRAYVSDLGDHRALEQLRRILRLLTSLKVVSVLPPPARDPTPLSLLPFGRLKVLELRGCDLSSSAAKGLLELRHTLEKLICHNSTDALRHVFASRIADIKISPHWNRLSFVSCPCNGLILMDESLQLLPIIETLDLSRNKFTKVDNLKKCNKLKHLDIGFNHLRTVACFSEVSCQIVKLVLRNNALTTLCGIENLKSLEGLDLSYNIISNFSELEILAGLPSLQSLWLDGNPLCSARWYRAQVFSYLPHPQKLKLDENNICKREFWKRQIIIASRQKRPASFGFYSPANDADLRGSINTKRNKTSRLVIFESEDQSTYVCSDEESASCENEIWSKEEDAVSDDEAELDDLMNRIELMNKGCSNLWLQEFKGWMDFSSENFTNARKHSGVVSNVDGGIYVQNKTRHKQFGESSRHMIDLAFGDESSMNILESDSSFADMSAPSYAQQYSDQIDAEASTGFFLEHTGGRCTPALGTMDLKERLKSYYQGEYPSLNFRNSHLDLSAATQGNRMDVKTSGITLIATDNVIDCYSSPSRLGSPPHYQEDILHRRHNLEEEVVQLSADSHSVSSSNSDTSYSEDDFFEFGPFIPKKDQSLIDKLSERSVNVASSAHHSEDAFNHRAWDILQTAENGKRSNPFPEQNSVTMENKAADYSQQICGESISADLHGEIVRFAKQEIDWLKKKEYKRKAKRRVILLSEENSTDCETALSQKPNGILDPCVNIVEDQQGKEDIQVSLDKQHAFKTASRTLIDYNGVLSGPKVSSPAISTLIECYFNSKISDFGVQETCKLYVCCNCLLEETPKHEEREVVVLLSSEHKLYVLLINGTEDGSG